MSRINITLKTKNLENNNDLYFLYFLILDYLINNDNDFNKFYDYVDISYSFSHLRGSYKNYEFFIEIKNDLKTPDDIYFTLENEECEICNQNDEDFIKCIVCVNKICYSCSEKIYKINQSLNCPFCRSNII